VKLQKDLREFVELLNSLRVDYMVVGSHAVAFHGHPRFTGDIDFLVRPTRERLLKNKQAAGRDQDLADLKKLRAIAARKMGAE
jgi:hypothetical protein